MDLHIYDMKLESGAPIIMTGEIKPDELQNFTGYLKILQTIFVHNPVIYVPDDATLDAMTPEELTGLLRDAMPKESLDKLLSIVGNAVAAKEVQSSEV